MIGQGLNNIYKTYYSQSVLNNNAECEYQTPIYSDYPIVNN